MINYREKDFSKEVTALTDKKGATLIFEHIGPETWNKNLACLAKGGRMITCGATSGPKGEMDLLFTYMKQPTIKGSYLGSHAELLKVLDLVEQKKLKPVIDKVFPLSQAQAAHDNIESRANFGKVILKP